MPNTWGNGDLWGDGGLYDTTEGDSGEYSAERELHYHRVSLRVNYTAEVIPGGSDAFRIYDLRLRLAPDRQASFTHEAFVDATTPSERLSLRITHAGSEFNVNHLQLIASRKKHQPKG